MNLIVLADNNPNPQKDLLTEHGLSIYFEADGYKWLFDVGASGMFYHNAIKLGVDIAEVDYLVLSHGHADHTGGLAHFIAVNKKARIIISANMEGKTYYSCRKQTKRKTSIDFTIVKENNSRFIFADNDMQISENVWVLTSIPKIYATPKANGKLLAIDINDERLDNFNHEIILVVNTPKGIVVLSGCSHNGILNILSTSSKVFSDSSMYACIGGTHLINSDELNNYESAHEIEEIGKLILRNYPKMRLITGHCTGTNAQKQLTAILGNNFAAYYTGYTFDN